ncbi:MAG: heavy-metal-associated domain-containing protein, partial [Oscillospiraceae bacterium]|nr:heavy-metal-associated domain-containing protein [Oscillospiraceae bacterium]
MNNTQTVFRVRGMHCASCARNVEVNIGKLPAVQSVSVNLAGESAAVSFDADAISQKEIINAINKLGYKASLPSGNDRDEEEAALRAEKTTLYVSLIFSALLFIVAMGPMMGLFSLPYPL